MKLRRLLGDFYLKTLNVIGLVFLTLSGCFLAGGAGGGGAAAFSSFFFFLDLVVCTGGAFTSDDEHEPWR